MISKNNIYATLLASAAFLSSCQDQFVAQQVITTSDAPIVNKAMNPRAGQLIIKLKSGAQNQIAATRSVTSGPIVMSRSGVAGLDAVLNSLGAHQLSTVFPVDRSQITRTKAAGLDRWYVVEFDNSVELQEAANLFASLPEIEKVQYVNQRERIQPKVGKTPLNTYMSKSVSSAAFNDPMYGKQWYLENTGSIEGEFEDKVAEGSDLNAIDAWAKSTGDASIIVAVLDEGVMYDHPDLIDNMWVNEGEELKAGVDADGNGYIDDKHGYNFVLNKGVITYNVSGDTGHGTHVAGTIAAVNNNGIGISSIAGGDGTPNSGVKIMSCQIMDGMSMITPLEEAQAMKYAADNGAVILQCSWGYNSGDATYPNMQGIPTKEIWELNCPLEKEALDYFIHNAGSASGVIDGGLAIFAGGNESSPSVGFPGRYEKCISVAAIDPAFAPSTFTNYGKGATISAPGGDRDPYNDDRGMILSTVPPAVYGGELYGYMEGTSMACPQVSGVAALALSYAKQLRKHYKADEFKELLLKAVHPLDDYLKGYKVYHPFSGEFGDIQIDKMDLSKYRGRMGAGLTDAGLLLDMIADETTGAPMRIPNFTLVASEKATTSDLAEFFVDGESKVFQLTSTNPDVAKASIEGTILTLEGLKQGFSTLHITADGVDQKITITVRHGDNQGWM